MQQLTKKQRREIYKQMIGQNNLWLSNREPLRNYYFSHNRKFNFTPILLENELGFFCDFNAEAFGLTYCFINKDKDCNPNEVIDLILFFCIEITNTK